MGTGKFGRLLALTGGGPEGWLKYAKEFQY